MKTVKTHFFYQAKKSRKGTFKHEIEFFILNSPYRPVMNHAPNLRDTKKI